MIAKVRNRLLTVFLLFSLLIVAVVVASTYYFNRRQQIAAFTDEINEAYVFMQQDARTLSDFFIYETKNERFFKSGKSTYINAHKILFGTVKMQLDTLRQSPEYAMFDIEQQLDKIEIELDTFNSIFMRIVDFVEARGFNNLGKEGEMIKYADKLEGSKGIDLVLLLTIRRYEKDYINRNDNSCIADLHETAKQLAAKIKTNMSGAQRDSALNWLNKYEEKFDQLVELEKMVGIKGNYALKRNLDKHEVYLQSMFKDLVTNSANRRDELFGEQTKYFFGIGVLCLLLAVGLSFYLARRVTHDLTQKIT